MKSDGPPRSDAQLQLPLQEAPQVEAPPAEPLDAPPDLALRDDDAAARARALDATQSFIVRAPAGSGKTELLTQRVLALLAQADSPEEIVAITFTRKAAAEMKDRLLQAFEHVSEGRALPQEPHHALTMQLAHRASMRDRELGWQLAANPARLRVQTIDALALWLAQQLPITTRFAAITQVTEQAEPLYSAAAHATLSLIDNEDAQGSGIARHIERLLTHLDNDWPRVHRLLSGMLARRDQWLRHVGHLDRAALEAPMQNECSRQIERVCQALLAADAAELIALARYAAGNLPSDSRLSPCADLDDLPDASFQRLDAWRGLAALLLTNEGNWRARFSKSEGFPAFASAASFKQRIAALTDAQRSNETLRQALHGLRDLPAPHFTAAQWEVLESIVALLPRAAAELMLVFGDAGESDFVQLTRAAVDALGEDDTAADIAHALDARIRHLLIDEFQDTSITQFELIERLVANWQPGDGRTVFVVGDPMQSIYRFREAEVGLFLRAWNSGIAGVPLQRLQLARNFRSRHGLVDWANTAFVRVLPGESDMASGAVAFEPSVANQSSDVAQPEAVGFNALIDGSPHDEAARVVELVQRIQADDPGASIALLVRARPHLAQIVPALREAGLRFTAVELELLLARPLIGDLLALTRALEHLADKVAWLAVLRAPWCGLTLADLSVLAEGAPNATVWQLVCDSSHRSQLSSDGQQRLTRVVSVLGRALELRGRSPLTERVRETWWLLGGPACVSTAADHADAESFFDHLAQHEERRRGVPDIAAFEASLVRLYAAPDAQASGRMQVMTIHKAKGLEFDYVIVPGLDRVTMGDDAQLMQWLERPADSGLGELLLSPIYPPDADKKDDSIYCWIERLQQQRQAHEDERLLYVAATRACKQLQWLACIPTANGELSPPRENSLLHRLWSAVEGECRRALTERPINADSGIATASMTATYDQSLRRLPVDWTFPIAPPGVNWQDYAPSPVEPAVEFSWAGETARRIGIVVHRWLQRIADDALHSWDAEQVQAIAPHIERELAGAGIRGDELKAARSSVVQALTSALSNPRARWLLGPHNDARSELRLTVRSGSGTTRIVLDRTFVDANGARWIIDYKTGTHKGADVEGFLDREQLRYSGQLELYAQALGGAAHLGLYFPLLNGWREWKSEIGTG
jgi:ATP-dependent helicase/nuclease subunit A